MTEIQNRNKHTSLSHEEAFLYGWVGIICLHSNGLHKCAIYLKGIIFLKILISVARLCVVSNPNGILGYVRCSRRELKNCLCCASPYNEIEWGLRLSSSRSHKDMLYCLPKTYGLDFNVLFFCSFWRLLECAA